MGSIIMYTVKEAMETTIFYVELKGWYKTNEVKIGERVFPRREFVVEGFEVESSSLYDFVMESVDETTTPKGVAPRVFVEKEEVHFWKEDALSKYGEGCDKEDYDSEDDWEQDVLKCYVESLGVNATILDFQYFESSQDYLLEQYVISSWGCTGNKYASGKHYFDNVFLTEEEANDELFRRVYEYDFLEDCNRNTQYYNSYKEAHEAGIEMLCNEWRLDEEVVESVLRRQSIADQLLHKRSQTEEKAHQIQYEVDMSSMDEYLKLLTYIPNEKYKDTCARLSKLIGRKINTKVFHGAVKKFRNNYETNKNE